MTNLPEEQFDKLVYDIENFVAAKFTKNAVKFDIEDVSERVESLVYGWADKVYTNYN